MYRLCSLFAGESKASRKVLENLRRITGFSEAGTVYRLSADSIAQHQKVYGRALHYKTGNEFKEIFAGCPITTDLFNINDDSYHALITDMSANSSVYNP